jgi:hypothetical protein
MNPSAFRRSLPFAAAALLLVRSQAEQLAPRPFAAAEPAQ